MAFRAYAFTYVLGGITFLPLLILALLVPAWYLLPRTRSNGSHAEKSNINVDESGEQAVDKDKADHGRAPSLAGEIAASGTFAVLRRYDFQAAIAALNAKSSATGNALPGADGSAADDRGSNAGSESVYQSMYRSVFDRNKSISSTASLLKQNDPSPETLDRTAKRKPVPANVLYIVLRHGHLMVYDSPTQLEVKHVISLSHHRVSLQAGVGVDEEEDYKCIPEPDLFIKRTAIVLHPMDLPNGTMQQATHAPPKPFYFFSATSIEKEDFYHALLAIRHVPPVPRELDADALIKLQSTLHSSSLTAESRALNALIGRVMLALHRAEHVARLVRGKIEKKLARIQKPSFIPVLSIQSLDLGDSAPTLSNFRLRNLNINGDMTIGMDMRYNGGLSITLLAVARLDLGTRFKARTVDLMLKTSVQRISGTMLVRIKPPPSNRVWFCFETMPEMEIRVEPVVSERRITYGFVLRAIEERIRAAIGEGLVSPNWDDVPMPLADTKGSHARGGLWSDEGEEPPLQQPVPSETTVSRVKSESQISAPSLIDGFKVGDDAEAASSGSDADLFKLRSSATMPVEAEQIKRRQLGSSTSLQDSEFSSPSMRRKPVRSPSLTSPSSPAPIVAVDDQHVEPMRSGNLPSRPAQQARTLWRGRMSAGQQLPKDALEELREIRNQAEIAASKPSSIVMNGGESRRDSNQEEDLSETQLSQDSLADFDPVSQSFDAGVPRSTTMSATDSDRSSLASSSHSGHQGQLPAGKKTTILGATATAANAARTWGWNAIQKNKGVFPAPRARQEQGESQPFGRGQPLPPPGVPLPGPQKGLFSGMGSMRRKPVPALPPRRPRTEGSGGIDPRDSNVDQNSSEVSAQNEQAARPQEDEFGPWSQNSGQINKDSQDNVDVFLDDNEDDNEDENEPVSVLEVDDVASNGGRSDTAPTIEDEGADSDSSHKSSTMLRPNISAKDDALIRHTMTDEEHASASSPSIADSLRPPAQAPLKKTKVPPPLPTRRRTLQKHDDKVDAFEHDVQGSPHQQFSSRIDASGTDTDRIRSTTIADNRNVSLEEITDESADALHVPPSAAPAVAMENATSSLAKGEHDEPSRIDTIHGDTVTIKDETD